MMRNLRALLALALLPGCAGSPGAAPEPPAEPAATPASERAVRASVSSFRVRSAAIEDVELAVPLNATTRAPGECDEPLHFGGEIRLALRWTDDEGRPVRLLYTFFDAEGRPTSYNDMRGSAMSMHAPDSVPGTSILLRLGEGPAIVRNQGPGAGDGYLLTLEEALDAPELDVPRRRIEELRERCAGEALGG